MGWAHAVATLVPPALLPGVSTQEGAQSFSVRVGRCGFGVELRRIELLTSSMPWKRSTN